MYEAYDSATNAPVGSATDALYLAALAAPDGVVEAAERPDGVWDLPTSTDSTRPVWVDAR